MQKFAIGIPTLNRYDLFKPSLMLYTRDFPTTNIFVLDNGNQGILQNGVTIKENEKNIGVGASWNWLCDQIFQVAENALILNDDIYLGKKEKDIEDLLHKKKNKGCLLKATPDWCAFVLPKRIYEKVGKFDECFFPAYYEDNSYKYRMKLQGISVLNTPELNPLVYKSSSSLAKDPSILEQSKINKALYIDMWGGEPNQEKYKIPFNLVNFERR
jgi:GT2 family glycosyltransferase